MKIILIVNLSKTKESSTLSEVAVQICLIIFMFQYFCVLMEMSVFYSLVSTLMVQMTTSCPLSLEMSVLRAHSIDSASHSFHLPLFMLTLLVSILQILQITSLFQAFSKPNKAH